MANFMTVRTSIEQELGLGELVSGRGVAAVLGTGYAKANTICADPGMGFPAPVFDSQNLRLYAKVDIVGWLQNHDPATAKPSWGKSNGHRTKAPVIFYGEGKLYRDTRRFYALLDRVDERKMA